MAAFEAKTKHSITCRFSFIYGQFFPFRRAPWSISPALNPKHTCSTSQQLTSHSHQKYELNTYELLLFYNCRSMPSFYTTFATENLVYLNNEASYPLRIFSTHIGLKLPSVNTLQHITLFSTQQYSLKIGMTGSFFLHNTLWSYQSGRTCNENLTFRW